MPYISRTDQKDDSWFSEAESNDEQPAEGNGSRRETKQRTVSDEELRDMFARTAGFFSEFDESDAEESRKPKKHSSRRSPKKKSVETLKKQRESKTMDTCLQFDTTEATRSSEIPDLESDAFLSEFGTDTEDRRAHRRSHRKCPEHRRKHKSRRSHRDQESDFLESDMETDQESTRRSPRRRSHRSGHSSSPRHSSSSKRHDKENEHSRHRQSARRLSLKPNRRHQNNGHMATNRRNSHTFGDKSDFGSHSDHELVKQRKTRRSSLLGAMPADEAGSELDFSTHSQRSKSPRYTMTKSPRSQSSREGNERSPRQTGNEKAHTGAKVSTSSIKRSEVRRQKTSSIRRRSSVSYGASVDPNMIVQNVKRKYGRTVECPTDTEDESSRMDESVHSRRRSIQHAWKEKEQFKAKAENELGTDKEDEPVDRDKENRRQELLNQSRKGPIRASSRLRERGASPNHVDSLLGDDTEATSASESERVKSTRRRMSLDAGYGEDSIYGSIDELVDNRRNRQRRRDSREGQQQRRNIQELAAIHRSAVDPRDDIRRMSMSGAGSPRDQSKSDGRRKDKAMSATCGQSYDKSIDELLKARRLRGANQRSKANHKEETKKFSPIDILSGASLFK